MPQSPSGAGPKPARPPASRWNVPERYDVRSILGVGSYSSVCEAYDRETKSYVAIKRVRHLFDDLEDCKRILREAAILTQVSHECVVRVHGIFAPPGPAGGFSELYMVMEMCDTDLRKLLRAEVTLSALHIKVLVYHLLRGLKYLHSAGVYHRDLKPPNCLVNEDCVVKITDFNLSCAVGELEPEDKDKEPPGLSSPEDAGAETEGTPPSSPNRPRNPRVGRQLTQHVVSRWYRAPEVILLQKGYTEDIDTWSAGCIFAELLQMLPDGPSAEDRSPLFPGVCCFPLSPGTRRPSSGGEDQLGAIFGLIGTPSEAEVAFLERKDARRHVARFGRIAGSGLQERLPYAGDEALDLLGKMLRFDPAERISMGRALAQPYLAEVREEGLETTATRKVTLEFEREPSLDEARLRHYLGQVIRKYSPVDSEGVFAIAGA